jgi:hypothetical protein
LFFQKIIDATAIITNFSLTQFEQATLGVNYEARIQAHQIITMQIKQTKIPNLLQSTKVTSVRFDNRGRATRTAAWQRFGRDEAHLGQSSNKQTIKAS